MEAHVHLMKTTCLIRFPLPEDMTADQARARFRSVAGDFASPPGLLRKLFLLTEDGRTSVGIYIWASRDQAADFNDRILRVRIRSVYGVDPDIQYLETVVEVDNEAGEIRA